jgi:hypothetical protein
MRAALAGLFESDFGDVQGEQPLATRREAGGEDATSGP